MRLNLVLPMVLCAALFGCSTEKSSPAGIGLLGRDPGEAVALPPIPMKSGESFQEIILPIIMGQREEILIGQMNGFQFQSLFRFRVPVDSLARAAGGVAGDFVAGSLSANLGLRSSRLIDHSRLLVLKPEQGWTEIQAFIDSLTRAERPFPVSILSGATAQVTADTAISVNLPISYLDAARATNPTAPEFDFMVAPDGIDAFLLDVVAREGQTIVALGRHPRLVLPFHVGSVVDTFRTEAVADTYWGRRSDGGPPRDKLLVSKGTFFSSILNFEIPAGIPVGSTINSAQLELDLDLDHSYFTAFPLEIYHVEFKPSIPDTVFTLYNTQSEINPEASVKIVFNQSLIQAWMSGVQVNQGMAIRAVGAPLDFTWFLIRDARLNVIYSTPPEL
jgi:hypothetical protein